MARGTGVGRYNMRKELPLVDLTCQSDLLPECFESEIRMLTLMHERLAENAYLQFVPSQPTLCDVVTRTFAGRRSGSSSFGLGPLSANWRNHPMIGIRQCLPHESSSLARRGQSCQRQKQPCWQAKNLLGGLCHEVSRPGIAWRSGPSA